VICGYVYRPVSGAARGAVIFLSGSAGSNTSQAGEAAAAYTSLGAAVFGIDYRGLECSALALDGGGSPAYEGLCPFHAAFQHDLQPSGEDNRRGADLPGISGCTGLSFTAGWPVTTKHGSSRLSRVQRRLIGNGNLSIHGN